MSTPSRCPRARVAAVCIAVLTLMATVLGGATSHDRGADVTGTAAVDTEASAATTGPELAWTDAMWTDTKAADGAFIALQLGGVQNFVCTAGLWTAATVNWARPTGTPSGVVSYRVTVHRAGTSQTTTQTTTTFTYRRPALNFDDVTIAVQPVIGQWTGPTRSMVLEAVPVVGMRCP